MIHTLQLSEFRRGLLLAAALAVLWAALAVALDDVTYHLAPLIVAAVPAIAARGDQPPAMGIAIRLATVGLGGGLGVTILLNLLDRLEGPSLLPFGDATLEAMIFSAVGAGGAWLFAARSARAPRDV